MQLQVTGKGIAGEKRVDPFSCTVAGLKEMLYTVVGIKPGHQKLMVGGGELAPDSALLCVFTPLMELQRVNVVNMDPTGGIQAMLSAIPDPEITYKLSEEEYAKRTDTFRSFKENVIRPKNTKVIEEEVDVQVGERCELYSESEFPRRGEVAYVGPIEGKKGVFVGVCLDEPYGKNDGSVGDQRYFKAMKNYGIFVRPKQVDTGDYPVLEEDSDDLYEEL